MKTKLFLRSFFYLLFTVLIFSCSEPCDDVNCGDNGTCLEGLCICDDGYEGLSCETEERSKFLGDWNSKDYTCGGGSSIELDWKIEKGEGIRDVIVTFDSVKLNGTFEGNTITIPLQNLGTTYQGMLVLDGGQIALTIEITTTITTFNCSATLTM